MQSRHGQERGNRSHIMIHAAVRQNEDIHAFFDGLARFFVQVFQRLLQRLVSAVNLIQKRNRNRFEMGALDMAQLLKLFVRQNGALEFNLAAAFGFGLKQISFRAECGVGGRHDFFADTVNRRIRDLSKELLEIIV